MIAIAEDILDAQEAQIEVHAGSILCALCSYEDLIGRMAENDQVQQELHLLSIGNPEYMTRPERTIFDALRAAAMEIAKEELS